MSSDTLFYWPTRQALDQTAMRAVARREVERSPLITACAHGNRSAACALKIGFWPFVREFELAIDRRVLPRGPLQKKFGRAKAVSVLLRASRFVRQMQDEEGSHAQTWAADAAGLGIGDLGDVRIVGVQALIDAANTDDLCKFFCVLAGTEFIAEELSRRLVGASHFTQLFVRRRWVWGEIHLETHSRPSHLDIDLDLALAYAAVDTDAAAIERMVEDCCRLFGQAAQHTYSELLADLYHLRRIPPSGESGVPVA